MVQNYRCTNSYSYHTEEKASYQPTWIPNNKNSLKMSEKDASNPLVRAFIHNTAAEQGDDTYTGTMASYFGGGYSANLGSSLGEAQSLLQDLENNRCIDMYTRAVFVEFNILNPGSG